MTPDVSPDLDNLREELTALHDATFDILGVFIDARQGFSLVKNRIEKAQKHVLDNFRENDPDMTLDDLDQVEVIYGEGDPSNPSARSLHWSTQGDLKQRNRKDGSNTRLLGNMCLVVIYQMWENEYRGRIADALGKKPKDVQSKVMGDMRHLRNAIIHNGGVATGAVERKCHVLNWYNQGDQIFLDKDKMLALWGYIQQGLQELLERHEE